MKWLEMWSSPSEMLREVSKQFFVFTYLSPLSIATQEKKFMKAFLNLLKERNALIKRSEELSLQMKVLELEDRKFEIEKELR